LINEGKIDWYEMHLLMDIDKDVLMIVKSVLIDRKIPNVMIEM
jgi:hypothetical protein